MTTNNICKLKSYKNWDMYAVHCDCSSEDHTQLLSIEYDPDFEQLTLNMSYNIYVTSYYHCRSDGGIWNNIKAFFKEAKYRIKWAYSILVHGYVEAHGDFIFAGKDAIKDYIDVLQEGLDKYPEISKFG